MSLRSCVFTGRLRLCIIQTMHQLYISGFHRSPTTQFSLTEKSRNRKYCPQLTRQYYCYDRTFYHFPQCKVCLLELKNYMYICSQRMLRTEFKRYVDFWQELRSPRTGTQIKFPVCSWRICIQRGFSRQIFCLFPMTPATSLLKPFSHCFKYYQC